MGEFSEGGSYQGSGEGVKSLYGLPIEDYDRFVSYGEASAFCWSSLHIALADGNLEDWHIEFCIDDAKKEEDTEGEYLGKKLLNLTMEQREDLYESVNK